MYVTNYMCYILVLVLRGLNLDFSYNIKLTKLTRSFCVLNFLK